MNSTVGHAASAASLLPSVAAELRSEFLPLLLNLEACDCFNARCCIMELVFTLVRFDAVLRPEEFQLLVRTCDALVSHLLRDLRKVRSMREMLEEDSRYLAGLVERCVTLQELCEARIVEDDAACGTAAGSMMIGGRAAANTSAAAAAAVAIEPSENVCSATVTANNTFAGHDECTPQVSGYMGSGVGAGGGAGGGIAASNFSLTDSLLLPSGSGVHGDLASTTGGTPLLPFSNASIATPRHVELRQAFRSNIRRRMGQGLTSSGVPNAASTGTLDGAGAATWSLASGMNELGPRSTTVGASLDNVPTRHSSMRPLPLGVFVVSESNGANSTNIGTTTTATQQQGVREAAVVTASPLMGSLVRSPLVATVETMWEQTFWSFLCSGASLTDEKLLLSLLVSPSTASFAPAGGAGGGRDDDRTPKKAASFMTRRGPGRVSSSADIAAFLHEAVTAAATASSASTASRTGSTTNGNGRTPRWEFWMAIQASLQVLVEGVLFGTGSAGGEAGDAAVASAAADGGGGDGAGNPGVASAGSGVEAVSEARMGSPRNGGGGDSHSGLPRVSSTGVISPRPSLGGVPHGNGAEVQGGRGRRRGRRSNGGSLGGVGDSTDNAATLTTDESLYDSETGTRRPSPAAAATGGTGNAAHTNSPAPPDAGRGGAEQAASAGGAGADGLATGGADNGDYPWSGGLPVPSPAALAMLQIHCPALHNYAAGFEYLSSVAPVLASRLAALSAQQVAQTGVAVGEDARGAMTMGNGNTLSDGCPSPTPPSAIRPGRTVLAPPPPLSRRADTDLTGSVAGIPEGAAYSLTGGTPVASPQLLSESFALVSGTGVLNNDSDAAVRPADLVLHALVRALQRLLQQNAAAASSEPNQGLSGGEATAAAPSSDPLLHGSGEPEDENRSTMETLGLNDTRSRWGEVTDFSFAQDGTDLAGGAGAGGIGGANAANTGSVVDGVPLFTASTTNNNSFGEATLDMRGRLGLANTSFPSSLSPSPGGAPTFPLPGSVSVLPTIQAVSAEDGGAKKFPEQSQWDAALSASQQQREQSQQTAAAPPRQCLPALMRAELADLLQSVKDSLETLRVMEEQIRSETSLLVFRVVSTALDWLIPAVYEADRRQWLFYRKWVCDLYRVLQEEQLLQRFSSILDQCAGGTEESAPDDLEAEAGGDREGPSERPPSPAVKAADATVVAGGGGGSGTTPHGPLGPADARDDTKGSAAAAANGVKVTKGSGGATGGSRPARGSTTGGAASTHADPTKPPTKTRKSAAAAGADPASSTPSTNAIAGSSASEEGKHPSGVTPPTHRLDKPGKSATSGSGTGGKAKKTSKASMLTVAAVGGGGGGGGPPGSSASSVVGDTSFTPKAAGEALESVTPRLQPASATASGVSPSLSATSGPVLRDSLSRLSAETDGPPPTVTITATSAATGSEEGGGGGGTVDAFATSTTTAVPAAARATLKADPFALLVPGCNLHVVGPGCGGKLCPVTPFGPSEPSATPLPSGLPRSMRSRAAGLYTTEESPATRMAQSLLDEGTTIPAPRQFLMTRLVAAMVRGMDQDAVRSLLATFASPSTAAAAPAAVGDATTTPTTAAEEEGEERTAVRVGNALAAGSSVATAANTGEVGNRAASGDEVSLSADGVRRLTPTPGPSPSSAQQHQEQQSLLGPRARTMGHSERERSAAASPVPGVRGGMLPHSASAVNVSNPHLARGVSLGAVGRSSYPSMYTEGPALVHHHRFRYPVVNSNADVAQLYLVALEDAETMLSPHDPVHAALVHNAADFFASVMGDVEKAYDLLENYLQDVSEERVQGPELKPVALNAEGGDAVGGAGSPAGGAGGGGGTGRGGSTFSVTTVGRARPPQRPPSPAVNGAHPTRPPLPGGWGGGATAPATGGGAHGVVGGLPQIPLIIPSWNTPAEKKQFMGLLGLLRSLQVVLKGQLEAAKSESPMTSA